MKVICESLKTMFFIFSSVIILIVTGCGKNVGSDEFNNEVIKEIQGKIPPGIPFTIKTVGFNWGESKSKDKIISGSFTAVATASTDLYELVPPGTDLTELMRGYITDDEINVVKSNLTAKLASIHNSTNDLLKTNGQYVEVTNKINYAQSLIDKNEKLECFSFATNGIEAGVKIQVTGTISATNSATKLNAKKWVPAEIEITNTTLTGRNLFVESNKRDSELIIKKSGTKGPIDKEIEKRKKIVSNAKNAVADAEKAVDDALEALRKSEEEKAEIAAEAAEEAKQAEEIITLTENNDEDDTPENDTGEKNFPTIVYPQETLPTTLNPWYVESGMSDLIRTNATEALTKLDTIFKYNKNHVYEFCKALALCEKGNSDSLARSLMASAINKYPKYKDNESVYKAPCASCAGKGNKLDVCSGVGCNNGKIQRDCEDCKKNKSSNWSKCKTCNGTKKIQPDCPICNGKGGKEIRCQDCGGSGKFFGKALGLK